MAIAKSFRFESQWLGLTKWLGNQKIKFVKGVFETNDEKVATFLRAQKECSEVIKEAAKEPAPAKKGK